MSEPITTVEEFNEAYAKIYTYASQLDLEIEASLFEKLLGQVKNLQKSGKSMEEMLAEMPENLRGLVKLNQIFEDFKKEDKDGRIELLTQNEFLDRLYDEEIIDSPFRKHFFRKMGSRIIATYSQERDYDLFNQLRRGLAQIIKDRGYNVDTLSLEDINFEEVYGTSVFNLYSNTTEESVYLGTFMDDTGDFYEMSLCDDKKKEEIVSKYPEMKDGIILTTKSGKVISYHGGEEYKLVTWDGIAESEEIEYHPSELEVWQQKLQQRIQQLKTTSQIENVPDIIIRNSKKLVQDASRIIEQIQNKSKILPEEIEMATSDISLEEMEAIMGKMTNAKERRQDALERGIGYGG